MEEKVVPILMAVVVLVGLKAGIEAYVFVCYLLKKHPDYAREELGLTSPAGYTPNLIKCLFQTLKKDDPKLHRIQKRAKKSFIYIVVATVILTLVFLSSLMLAINK